MHRPAVKMAKLDIETIRTNSISKELLCLAILLYTSIENSHGQSLGSKETITQIQEPGLIFAHDRTTWLQKGT